MEPSEKPLLILLTMVSPSQGMEGNEINYLSSYNLKLKQKGVSCMRFVVLVGGVSSSLLYDLNSNLDPITNSL